MKQHYTVTIEQIIEEPWMYGDCKRTDENSHGGQCFIVTQEEEAAFVCGFFPLTTTRDRIHQAMKIIFGEKAFKEMNLSAIPVRWKPQAWSVIQDWMAQNDYSSAESIAAFTLENTMTKPHFPEVAHVDHNITQDQLDWVNRHPEISKLPNDKFMIKVLEMPHFLEDAQCALYGPSVGDPAVENHETFLMIRGDRDGPSRMIDKPTRPARRLVVIGIKGEKAYTIYGTRGSEAAPLHPWEAKQKELPFNEIKRCRDFWNQHALSSQE